jgi:hypothetical protein
MRIDLLKIADHLGFKKTCDILVVLPDNISQNMTRKKWDRFLEKYAQKQEEQNQMTICF